LADRNKKRTPKPKQSSVKASTGPPQQRREKILFNHLITPSRPMRAFSINNTVIKSGIGFFKRYSQAKIRENCEWQQNDVYIFILKQRVTISDPRYA
ncbi:MAG: hypothetical protein P8098_20465, partial [Candidatus Thiodiazotropha sp.]